MMPLISERFKWTAERKLSLFRFKIINILVLLTGVCILTTNAEPFNNSGWLIWPRTAKIKVESEGTIRSPDKRVNSWNISIPDIVTNAVVYTYTPMQEKQQYKITFQYVLKDSESVTGKKLSLCMNFNKKDGINGGAGSLRFPLNTDRQDVQSFSSDVQTPEATVNCQFSIEISGIKGNITISDIKIEKVNDVFTIKKVHMPLQIDGKLSKDFLFNATKITNFYDPQRNASPAEINTEAYITYDDENLYVLFKNTEPDVDKIKHKVTDRDGNAWEDECNEVFLSSPNGNSFQFIVNSGNSQWDGRLYLRVPGDHYRADATWNGTWKSAVSKDSGYWASELCIPFSLFGIQPKAGDIWYINLARERHMFPSEVSQFNRTDSELNNVMKFAKLEFKNNFAVLSRNSENVMVDPFKITRKAPKYKSLSSTRPADYMTRVTCCWDFFFKLYPNSLKDKYTKETFIKEQENILSEYSAAGLIAPVALNWAVTYIPGGKERIKSLYINNKMKFWVALMGSPVINDAMKNGAVYITNKTPEPVDPKYIEAMQKQIKACLSAHKDNLNYIEFIGGIDEPLNNTYEAFSFTINIDHKEQLAALSEEIEKNFGFGRYGLYDKHAPGNDPNVTPFTMIAFMRWWNNAFAESIKSYKELVKEYAPGIKYWANNMNYTRTICNQDIALIERYSDIVSADPYPTSTLYNYGIARALYQTGFATKIIRDLSNDKTTLIYVQGFRYCGKTPLPSNIREWTSQALKNGAGIIDFYSDLDLTRYLYPEIYKEVLRESKLIRSMNKLDIPSETKTAIFFSNHSLWGTFDEAAHSHYSVYSILGENLKTWFRFVSDTQVKLKLDDLSKYSLIYLPQLKYTDADTAKRLLEYVKSGGRLVIFDPEAFTWNIDGTKLEQVRSELIGCSTEKAVDVKNIVASMDYSGLKKGDKLPLTPLAHIANAGKVLAFEITPPADAKIIANYPDGKPAAFERTVGKGSVIYFAAQPFGNADLAIKDSKWTSFMNGLAGQAGEKLSLPIWDFELPATGGEVEVKYVIKPDPK